MSISINPESRHQNLEAYVTRGKVAIGGGVFLLTIIGVALAILIYCGLKECNQSLNETEVKACDTCSPNIYIICGILLGFGGIISGATLSMIKHLKKGEPICGTSSDDLPS